VVGCGRAVVAIGDLHRISSVKLVDYAVSCGDWERAWGRLVFRPLSRYRRLGRPGANRLTYLLYHVVRDFVGKDGLTVPIRDPNPGDIEANRVGERVEVVPRARIRDGRVPTDLAFDDPASVSSALGAGRHGGGSPRTQPIC
jgi:hypothetical protein